MYASLPMNNFAEHRTETDRLWSAIAARLAEMGIAAPAVLDRSYHVTANCLRPDLLLIQTCGLPFARYLRSKVQLVGGINYDIPDCPPGTYRSRIIVRSDCAAQSIVELRGNVVACNEPYSQSGAGALRRVVLPHLDAQGRFFSRTVMTGAHVESIRAVVSGRADVAAIDAVTFAMAERYVPETTGVRVLYSTEVTTGKPLITALNGPATQLYAAIEQALEDVGPVTRSILLLRGLVPCDAGDFDAISDWDDRARSRGYAELDAA